MIRTILFTGIVVSVLLPTISDAQPFRRCPVGWHRIGPGFGTCVRNRYYRRPLAPHRPIHLTPYQGRP